MGAVYLGQHTLLGRRAAIKLLLPGLSSRPDLVNRFFNEARAVTSISDPGIVQVFDFGYHSDGSAFIVMEYLEGEPLDRRLARLVRLPAGEALRICRQLAGSLSAAHGQKIVHRDLKPENIFLVPDAEVASGERCKILDFGIAKLSDDHPKKLKTHTGLVMGTPVYMSPEQCRGLADVDHRADIYSLGCVLYHLLTGRPPFEGEGTGDIISAHIRERVLPPSSRTPETSPAVDALVLRCLAKSPDDRYQTMTELSRATGLLLSQLQATPPVTVAPTYHLLPTTKLPLGGTAATPFMVDGIGGAPSSGLPTTLGASSGQLALAGAYSRHIRRWITTGLVVAAAGAGIAIAMSSSSRTPQPSSRPVASTAAGSTSANENDAGMTAVIVPDSASIAVVPPGIASDAAESVSLNSGSAGSPSHATQSQEEPSPEPGVAVPHGVSVPPRNVAHRKRAVAEAPEHVVEAPRLRQQSPRQQQLSQQQTPLPVSQHQTITPAAPPSKPPTKSNCGREEFAMTYTAARPAMDAVRAALRHLNECRDSGAISDRDFEQTQAALFARL